MATVVLTAVGTALGGPIGAAIGSVIGQALDRAVLFKPRTREGARLSDLQIQTSSYGTQMPGLFGTLRLAGTVIWATDLRETRSRSGGGKGQASVASYSYSASFAVALSARSIRSVKRIWADGNLLRGAAGDFKTALGGFRVHAGGEDQDCDPLIAAAQGIALTPAHRGIAYVVFEDLSLADYGNRIPSLTFEVEADAGAVSIAAIAAALSAGQVGPGPGAPAWDSVDGYAASGADLGAALAPLVEAHGLALRTQDAGLSLSPAAEVAEADVATETLARRINQRAVEPIERSSTGSEAVPVALSLRYHDAARDYQAGVQRVTRPGAGRTESGVDLPAVLDSEAARTLAQRRLARAWAGRTTMLLRCGWRALVLEPGMVVSVAHAPGLWRIEDREWEAMAVQLRLRRVTGPAGPMPAGASSGAIVRQPDTPQGATGLLLADLPWLKEGTASAPWLVAAASGGPGWRQAALFAVDGGGAAIPIGRTAPRATMGHADMALPPGSPLLIDTAHLLSVTLLGTDMELNGADAAALGQGRNLCLLGSELIQFRSATQTGPASFRLAGLSRGLRGTEWAMADHVAGEPFLLIEEDRLVEPLAVPGVDGGIGAPLRLLAIGAGDVEPAQATVTVDGAALMPPSPVHLTARGEGDGWAIGWTRRSRSGWRWNNGGDVPLGEESEAYEVRVLDGTRLVRRAETLVPHWTYDAGMIAADGVAGTLSIEVRQVGMLAVGRPARIAIAT